MTKTEPTTTGKALFTAALDVPPAERRAFIAERCGDDARLREYVESLVAAHEEAGSFLASPTWGSPAGR